MKDPDTLTDAIEEAVRNSIAPMCLSPKEAEVIIDVRQQEAHAVCQRWFRYGEYLEVEIDTEARTCVVCPANGAAIAATVPHG